MEPGHGRELVGGQEGYPHQSDGHRRLRGSNVDDLASSSKRRRSSSLNVCGTLILTSARRSPASPRGFGIPRWRSRRRRPHELPAGTRIWTSPPGVATETEVPKAASQGDTGSSTWTFRPSRRNRGCGAIRTTRYRSPSGPEPEPAASLARKPDSLAFDHPRRDGHLQRPAFRWPGNRDASFPAPEGLIERDRELGLLVGAGDGTPPRPSCRSEQVPQEVLGVEPVRAEVDPTIPVESPRATPAIPASCRCAALRPGRWVYSIGDVAEVGPEHVIALALVRVGKDVIGLRDILEPLLGLGVLVHVRVVCPRQPPVGTLDLLRAGIPPHSQYLIEVTPLGAGGHHSPRETTTPAGRSTVPGPSYPGRTMPITVPGAVSSSTTPTASWRCGSKGLPTSSKRGKPRRARSATACVVHCRAPLPERLHHRHRSDRALAPGHRRSGAIRRRPRLAPSNAHWPARARSASVDCRGPPGRVLRGKSSVSSVPPATSGSEPGSDLLRMGIFSTFTASR